MAYYHEKNYFICLLLFIQFSVQGQEIRCGWLDNPTPGNLWLIIVMLSGVYLSKEGVNRKELKKLLIILLTLQK
ncbi:DUF4087 domain-containing protein [Providencia hangzhouensis]|uniref:DUF4087 domain-containing protein n=1 Tax=Providencia hangzhouensis TaxID=3031799 RepID=UPI0034DD7A7D